MSKTDPRTVDQKLIDGNFFSDQDAVYELFKQMRREDPVHWTVRDDGVGFWSVFKHAECRAVLDDAILFNTGDTGQMPPLSEEMNVVSRDGFGVGLSNLTTDPPRHTKVRDIFEDSFKPKAMADYEGRCTEIVESVFDSLPASGECDLVADIGARIPMAVISDILKIPMEDWEDILGWGKMSHQMFNHDAQTSLQGFDNMTNYCLARSNERRGCPMDDPLALLANAKVDGKPLSDQEIGRNGMLMLVAGFETTRNAFAGGVQALLEHPDQMQYLRENPKGMRLAVEEVVRWTNAAVAFRRMATSDTELGGKQIKKGDDVVVWFPSANRDEDVFENPDVFDVTRHPNQHIGFAAGAHFCLGAPLAKLELAIALQEVLARYDGIEVTGPVSYIPSNFVFGLERMPVRLKRKTAA
ncbi:MAG: cytochrome P450 [Gammaproteobacteria bacterium]